MLVVAPQFGNLFNRVYVTVHKAKVIAILNTGSPVNVISSCISHKIKMTPNLNHSVVQGTTGLSIANSIGAHLGLPLCFGNLVLKTPAVALENEDYDLLIGA